MTELERKVKTVPGFECFRSFLKNGIPFLKKTPFYHFSKKSNLINFDLSGDPAVCCLSDSQPTLFPTNAPLIVENPRCVTSPFHVCNRDDQFSLTLVKSDPHLALT